MNPNNKDIFDEDYLKEVLKRHKAQESVIEKYKLYTGSKYGEIANKYVYKITQKITNKFPLFFKNLAHSLTLANINILSKTYFDIMIFTTILIFIIPLIPITILLSDFIILRVLKSIVLSTLMAGITFFIFYIYPISLASSRRRRIRNDLPFVIVHMSAVAGSGAHPITMFSLILKSGEYKGIEGEIKKIVNYVNLFGYDLTTALKTVSITTPSKRFSELLTGLATTIETGGDIREYLDVKAEDALNTYRLERKKYVETVSTYSDIYTGVLIAAPLLFFVTVAIIQLMGGAILGLSVKTLAIGGTFVVIPLLNIGYLVFINFIQPET